MFGSLGFAAWGFGILDLRYSGWPDIEGFGTLGGVRSLGVLDPWASLLGGSEFWVHGILASWIFGPGSAHLDLRLSVWLFVAGRMVLRFFLGSHGTLVAVSAPLLMPLRDSGHSNECSLYVL